MSTMNLPLEIYDILERRLGRDDAMPVAKAIEESLSRIEARSVELSMQRKIEVKESLRVELRDELATKADLAELRGATKADIAELRDEVKSEVAKIDKKFTVFFITTIFTVILLNQNALELLVKILGILK